MFENARSVFLFPTDPKSGSVCWLHGAASVQGPATRFGEKVVKSNQPRPRLPESTSLDHACSETRTPTSNVVSFD